MSIYEKLNNIQIELKANKNQFNAFGKYKYRSLEDIQEALKPLLKKYRCVVTLSDDIVLVGDRFYNKSIAKIIEIDEGNSLEVSAMAREPFGRKGMDEAQVTVATSSYSRKSAMNGLLAIDDNRDPDTTTQDEEPNSKPETLNGYLKDKGVVAKDFASYFMLQAKDAKTLLQDKPKLAQMVNEFKNAKNNTAK